MLWISFAFWGSIALSILLWKQKRRIPVPIETVSPLPAIVGIVLVLLQIYPVIKAFPKLAESGAKLIDNPFQLLSIQLLPSLTLLGFLIANVIWLFHAIKTRQQQPPPLLDTIVTGSFLLVIQINYLLAIGLAFAMLVVPAISPIIEGSPLEPQKLILDYLKIHSGILTALFVACPLLMSKPILLKKFGQWLFRR